jgi:hypothetical protein
MINSYDHPDAGQLVPSAAEVVPRIAEPIGRAGEQDAPVVCVNDTFGSWRSDQDGLVAVAMGGPHTDLELNMGAEVCTAEKVRFDA